jgi:hypothetical protein
MKPPKKSKPEIEADPDAWQRFERAIDVVVKTKPQHREAPKPKRRARKTK